MKSSISYSNKLDEYVKSDDLIPYRLHHRSRYRTNCYYWIDYDGQWLKAEEVKYIFKGTRVPILDHVLAKYQDNNRSWICTDLTIYDFWLEKDINNVKDQDIINSDVSYSGGEIEYWLFRHDATLIGPYREILSFFYPANKSHIDSHKYYFVKGDLREDGSYTNVRIIIDPTREKFKRPKENLTVQIDGDKPIERNDILKERNRRKQVHETQVRKRKKHSCKHGKK